jgi:hypothetical protein
MRDRRGWAFPGKKYSLEDSRLVAILDRGVEEFLRYL